MGSSSATTSGTRFSSSQASVVPDRGSPVTSTFRSSTSGPGYGTGREPSLSVVDGLLALGLCGCPVEPVRCEVD